MGEAIKSTAERREAGTMVEFLPKGTHRLDIPGRGLVTIVLGEIENGQGEAIVFPPEAPPENILGTALEDESGPPDTFLQRLRDSRAIAVLGALGAFGAVASACGNSPEANNHYNGGEDFFSNDIGTNTSALSMADAPHFGPSQPIPWAQVGDAYSSIVKIEDGADGKQAILFARNGSSPIRQWYVDCNKLEDCISQGVPTQISGIPSQAGSVYAAYIFQDQNGNNRIRVNSSAGNFEMNVDYIGGVLTAHGTPVVGGGSPTSGFTDSNNVPHVMGASGGILGITNLHTNAFSTLPWQSDPAPAECGHPHVEDNGGIAIGSILRQTNPNVCKLFVAPTLDQLLNSLVAVDITAAVSPTGNPRNPRIGGNVLIYSTGAAYTTQLYYALVQPYCGDETCNGAENSTTCVQDCPVVCVPDCEDKACGSDGCDGTCGTCTATQICDALQQCIDEDSCGDGTCDPGETSQNCAEDCPVVCVPDCTDKACGSDGCDGTCGTCTATQICDALQQCIDEATDGGPSDAGTEPDGGDQTDGGTPDGGDQTDGGPTDGGPTDGGDGGTPPDECDFANAKIDITAGACNLQNCEYPYVDVVGDCTFEVDIGNPRSAIIEIEGAYELDLLDNAGNLLHGKYKVTDRGNNLPTNYGSFVTGVAGTTYGGEGAQIEESKPQIYKVWCSEGKISVSYNDELIVELEGDPGAPIRTFVDGTEQQPTDGGEPDGGDGGTEIDGGQEDGGEDAGTEPDAGEKPDGGTVADGGKIKRPPRIGCHCTSYGDPASIGILALSLMALRRKKDKKA